MDLKKQKLSIFLAIGVVALITTSGVSFAYYVRKANINSGSASLNTKTTKINDVNFTVAGNLTFSNPDIYPGYENVSSITLNAKGDKTTNYNLVWYGTNTLATLEYTVYKGALGLNPSINCTKTSKWAGTYKKVYSTCTRTNFDSLGTAVKTGTIAKAATPTKINLLEGESITPTTSGVDVAYYVVLKYPNDTSNSQNGEAGGGFTGEVTIGVGSTNILPTPTS